MKIALIILGLYISFCGKTGICSPLAPEAYKAVLVGRKDLIRNAALESNNQVFKELIQNQNLAIQSLNKQLFILLDENKELKRQLKECKGAKK